MKKQTPCPECGKPLAEGKSVCPACLMGQALASKTLADTLHGDEALPDPPSPEEIADKFPQFEIVECLGRGGMGVVYKARQKSLDRWVAIKVLAPERVRELRFAEHFEREAKTLAKMSQSNIVTVFDHGETEGLFYIVMEYVDGVNLRDLLREGKIEPEQALAIVPPICEALEYAHDHGVVHRDIKPENILIDREGRVKIADFGIASLVGASGERSGTPPYMAPEQEMGVVDRRADIYALGAVLYEMLTGERPDKDLVAPSKRVEIDVRLDEIVLRAMEKEPARRYQTAGEFRTVVQTMAASEGKAPAQAERALGQVKGPAIGLIVTGALNWILSALVFIVLGMRTLVAVNHSSGGGTPDVVVILPLIFAVAVILLSSFLIYAGLKLMKLESRGAGITASILAMVIAPGNIVGLPIGIWALVVLNRREVREAFKGGSDSPNTSPASFETKRRGWEVTSIVSLIVAVPALLFWAQQPRMIDERTIAADSPDERFSAMGQTWHAMRIMGGDRTFYRFIVQGQGGAVSERWEVPVPIEKLAASDVALSRDEILFGRHGRIVWSEGGKRVSFRVNGTEVSAYNTEDGGHSFEGGFLPQRVVELTPAPDTGCAFLDLDEGDVPKPTQQEIRAVGSGTWVPNGLPQLVGTGIAEWMRSNGADLVMRGATDPHVTLLDGASLIMAELTGPRADFRAFDTIPAERVVEAVSAVERTFAEGPRHDPPLFGINPGNVHAVKTREGAIALVEILEASDRAPLRLRYKLVEPETTVQAAYVGEWEWHEGGGSDDFAVLILKNDGTAVVMEDGEDGEKGEWSLLEEGITLTVGANTIAGFLDPDGCLALGKNRGAPRFTRKGEEPRNPSDATTGQSAGNAVQAETAEHAARAFMTAMRDGDIDGMMTWISPEMKAHAEARKMFEGLSEELRNEIYVGKLDQLTEFTEWYPQNHDANTRFVGTRVAGGNGTGRFLYLILSPTPEGWKVAHLDDASSDKPLSHYVDRIVRILPGEGPLFREQPTQLMAPPASEAGSASTEEGLAPGINVEVLAVAEIPANGHWWNADGNEVENIYWDDTAVAHEETKNNRQVILRLNSPETDPELKPSMNLSVHRKSTRDSAWGGGGFVTRRAAPLHVFAS